MSIPVPFLDLITPHLKLEEELVSVFRESVRNARFIGGPAVEGFEKDFALFCDAKQCIGVNSGTDALRFALMAAGVKPGETVVTVPNTFIATTEAITQAGARFAFVDIDEATCNMDVAKLGEYLETQCRVDESGRPVDLRTGSTVAAVVPVHLYGQIADMDGILALAERYHLIVVEDACQAHGAQYFSRKENRWKKAGSFGSAAAFSFYPGKNLGACGEGGAVTTEDDGIAREIRMIRDHGQAKKYYHDIEGYNGRLDAIQAGILSVKLKHLADWNEQRRACARRYNELLAGVDGVTIPFEPEWSRAVYHLYVIRTKDRDRLQQDLASGGIFTALHYPIPLHLQKAYENGQYGKGDFPVTERVAEEILSLPMFPGLTEEQQVRVADGIKNWLRNR